MVAVVRRFRLRSRLLGAFGLLCVLLAGITFIGVYTAGQQERDTVRVGRLSALNRAVMQLKFRDTDVSGWQVAYARSARRRRSPTTRPTARVSWSPPATSTPRSRRSPPTP